MRLRPLTVVLLLAVIALAPAVLAAGPMVRYVEFDTEVTSVTVQRIIKAIDTAEAQGEDLVLVRIDTPGGLLSATETLVQRMLASEVPVVVWVGPSGTHAASAGFFILMAADVAAMAPGTRTGAASTVFGNGEGSDDNVLLRKANQDTAALLRSLAERRGRDKEAAEKTVFDAASYEESAALEARLIDLIAADRDELLEMLDGFALTRFNGDAVVLETAGAEVIEVELDWRQQMLEVVGSPALAQILLLLGFAGLYFEYQNPGLIFPAVLGVVCLIAFAFAAQILPVSAFGILLIVGALVLFVLELKFVSHGLLSLGGLICLILGSSMLIDGPIPELRVPWTVYVPMSLMVGGLMVVALRFAISAQRVPVATGVEGLAGSVGEVSRVLDGGGKVFVNGEVWDAHSNAGDLVEGMRVRVVAVDGMQLTVEPADAGERS
ncbi:hypothetical protein ABI59_04075 [Acidobacteria bacterium Mor1]|nr:hypothetical protein ABI59_04075 [Acidobacteria bacterium Mor1]